MARTRKLPRGTYRCPDCGQRLAVYIPLREAVCDGRPGRRHRRRALRRVGTA